MKSKRRGIVVSLAPWSQAQALWRLRASYRYGGLVGCGSVVTVSCSSIPSSGRFSFGLVKSGQVCGLAMRVFSLIIYFSSEEHYRV